MKLKAVWYKPLVRGKKPYNPVPQVNNSNFYSWMIITAILDGYGPTSYGQLANVCSRHEHGTEADKGKGGKPWINYLLKNDYLQEIDSED